MIRLGGITPPKGNNMTFKFIPLLLTGAALTALSAIPVFAKPASAKIEAIDTNNDGQLSFAEYNAAAQLRFSSADANRDSLLSKDEVKAQREARKQASRDARFDRVDANNDGVLTKEETERAVQARKDQRQARRVERLDTDRDGAVSEVERAAARAERVERRKAKRAERGERREARKASGGGKKKKGARIDANQDGFISLAEYDASVLERFNRQDVNGDGYLDASEMKTRKGKGRKGRKGKKGQRGQ